MKYFINPVELLGLAKTDLAAINKATIKQAKKALMEQIALSEDKRFNCDGIQLTGSDCEAYIDELGYQERLKCYHFIANLPQLTAFLVYSDETFFRHYIEENIYKEESFIRLISPWFATAYDRMLWEAWQRNDGSLGVLTAIPPMVLPYHMEIATAQLTKTITWQIEEVKTMMADVMDKSQIFDLSGLPEQVEMSMDRERLNMLPAYFQELRNRMAAAVRNLTIEINDTRGNTAIALQINEAVQLLRTDGIAREAILRDHEEFSKIMHENSLVNEEDPIAALYLDIIRRMAAVTKAAVNPDTDVSGVKVWVDGHIDVAAINALNERYIAVRHRLALGLNELGGAVWKGHRDKQVAMHCIETAERIEGLDNKTRGHLTDAKLAIYAYYKSTTRLDNTGSGSKFPQALLYVVIGLALLLFLFKFFGN